MSKPADIRKDFPASLAFITFGFLEHHANALDFGQAERFGRARITCQLNTRSDADILKGHRFQRLKRFGIAHMHHRCRLKARSDHLVRTLHLERGGNDRRTLRIAAHFSASSASRQSAGVSGMSTRWIELSSPG